MSELQSVQALATTWIKAIAEHRITPEQLETHQRRIIVRYMLRERKWLQWEIAEFLHTDPATITRDKQRIQRQNAWQLDLIDERRMALELMEIAELAGARLIRKGKEYEAWRVARECADALQSLGYLQTAPVSVQGGFTFMEVLNHVAGNGRPSAAALDVTATPDPHAGGNGVGGPPDGSGPDRA